MVFPWVETELTYTMPESWHPKIFTVPKNNRSFPPLTKKVGAGPQLPSACVFVEIKGPLFFPYSNYQLW